MSNNDLNPGIIRHLEALGVDPHADGLNIIITGEDGKDSRGDRWAAVGPVSDTDRRPCVWFLEYQIDRTERLDVDVYTDDFEDVERGGALETLKDAVATALDEGDRNNGDITLEINYWALALTGAMAA